MIGKYCIIRTEKAGVFAGEIISRNGSETILKNCRKLWYWSGASAVEELALNGVKNKNDCKFTVTVDEIIVMDTIQIIPCTEKAKECILSVKDWKIN
jgi:hypothetical protein